MKKIKYIAGIWILLLLISMVSCKSDDQFLKEDPKTFYTVDNAFSLVLGQVDQLLVGIYSHLRNLWTVSDESQWIFKFRGNGTDMLDVPNIRRPSNFNDYSIINPDNDAFYQNYSTWYYVISRANLALYAAELSQISWSSDAEKSYAVAQARFFRAFAYRNSGRTLWRSTNCYRYFNGA